MFEPTRILREEHDVILRGLEFLESYSEKLQTGDVFLQTDSIP